MGKKILVIDDTFETRNLAKIKLEEAGYQVMTSADGVEALKTLKDHPVDLVLTDYRMPSLGGQDWIELLEHHYPQVKKIVISGYPFVENQLPKNIPLISKPIRWEDVVNLIKKLLGQ